MNERTEAYIESLNQYLDKARKQGYGNGYMAGNYPLLFLPDTEVYKRNNKLNEPDELLKIPRLSLLPTIKSKGRRTLDVQMEQIAISRLKGYLGALFTWDLVFCTGIAFKAEDVDGNNLFGLGHFFLVARPALSSFLELTGGRFRITDIVSNDSEMQDLGLKLSYETIYEPFDNEVDGFLVTKDGVTILKEVTTKNSVGEDVHNFEVKQTVSWN